jgi:hypothetical protein
VIVGSVVSGVTRPSSSAAAIVIALVTLPGSNTSVTARLRRAYGSADAIWSGL